ncbi:CAMK family protein kinase [Trichomonas vaginalis G3]|uniref:Serine/threonine-protein kinase PLK n=1 Tax=Trichomonas vaginalis (strain ATCC PRA-98 / G3) TaxID=412133 RepID=A2FR69_TRIV3|nr:regulation of centriole replication [Trichomonas vaginalis G3]EAX92585.1 CAMK family protein kinase [Trichomonas vaginalis G3]KAI5533828.1 regulation of centriole replication [Trichomonas vaginalis G3]|eukprot:XP_001305515.1 CAMK family protein kinase [Trichomonas vaginalis G3]
MEKPAAAPDTIISSLHGHAYVYKKQDVLGIGGFATVYKVFEKSTSQEYAMKVIPKDRITKPKAQERLKLEIQIQSALHHPNVLRSYGAFEDATNHYIVTELCPGLSIRDLLKKKGNLTEFETVKVIKDVLEGLVYLHDNRVIHRDIKLENFLVGKDGRVKIADFGLSTKLSYDDEKKYTVCGTPNYLSPEILADASKGHSYEVDIWAIGVSVYAMLIGRPPFQTARTKLTYEHIKTCSYLFPVEPKISQAARDFIKSTLQIKPELRPTAQELLYHEFITQINSPEFQECNKQSLLDIAQEKPKIIKPVTIPRENPRPDQQKENVDNNCINAFPIKCTEATMPRYCVSRFCDHAEKYGLGYLLIDGTIGACFNDSSRMIMDPHEEFVQYWPDYQTFFPEILSPHDTKYSKKLLLIRKFSENLKTNRSMFQLPTNKYKSNIPLKHVKYWIRTDYATLFRMENRDIQVNFTDKIKIVIFWSTKKMMMLSSIKQPGKLIGLNELYEGSPYHEEHKRFVIAKQLLEEMSAK